MFAKIFGSDGSKILVILDVDHEDGPSVRVMVHPDGLGLCESRLGYKTEDAARKAFGAMEEPHAQAVADSLRKDAAAFTGG